MAARAEGIHRVAGVERTVSLEVRPLGGVELRPTRAFVWIGAPARVVRVIPLSSRPRPLRRPRRSRAAAIGPLRLSFVGSPLLTLGLASTRAVARAVRPRPEGDQPPDTLQSRSRRSSAAARGSSA